MDLLSCAVQWTSQLANTASSAEVNILMTSVGSETLMTGALIWLKAINAEATSRKLLMNSASVARTNASASYVVGPVGPNISKSARYRELMIGAFGIPMLMPSAHQILQVMQPHRDLVMSVFAVSTIQSDSFINLLFDTF